MEDRVNRLEVKVSKLCAKVAVMENDLAHGAKVFAEIKTEISRMLSVMLRVGSGITVGLGGIVIGLVVYIFNTAH